MKPFTQDYIEAREARSECFRLRKLNAEILDALKAFMIAVDEGKRTPMDLTIEKARAAIAKVEGRDA